MNLKWMMERNRHAPVEVRWDSLGTGRRLIPVIGGWRFRYGIRYAVDFL
jgi:hypothetical protein